MASTFKIVITASDKATATVRKVKDAIAQFNRPITQVKASVSALGKELGVDRMAKGIGRLAIGARNLASRAVNAMSAVAGIAGATTLAGMAVLARTWAMMGLEVTRFAGLLDMTTTKYQTLTGAAEAFGLERSAMANGLKALGDTMEDALFGRNQDALVMMNKLGISMHRTRDGSVDTARGLYDVADAISHMHNVQAQGLVARTFGVEELLPFLKQGSKGIKEYEDAVKRSGAVMSGPALEASNRFARQLIFLKLAAAGTGNAIMAGLVPVLAPLVDQTTKWLLANREVIATDLREFVTGLVGPIVAVAKAIGWVINSTIGWKGAGLALAAMIGSKLIPMLWALTSPLLKLTGWLLAMSVRAIPLLIRGIGFLAGMLADVLAPAFASLGVAIEATPVGWIVTALAAIGIAGYELWKHWREISDGFAKIWQRIPDLFIAGYRKIAPVIKALSYIPVFGVPFAVADAAVAGLEQSQQNKKIDPKVAAQAMAFYQKKGWTKEQAAGLVGNMAWESGLNPQKPGDDGNAYGLAQWHRDRAAEFKKWSGGRDLAGSSLQQQLEFSNFELTQGKERAAGDALRKQKDVRGATAAANYAYERPAAPAASEADREALAAQFYAAEPAPAGAPGKPGLMAQMQAAGGKSAGAANAAAPAESHITVHIKGLPKGSKVEVASTGKKKPDVRVDYAMPDLATM